MKFKDKQEVPHTEATAPLVKVLTETDLEEQILEFQNQLVQAQTQAVAIQGAIQATTKMRDQLRDSSPKDTTVANGKK